MFHRCKKAYGKTARLFLPQATTATSLTQWSKHSLEKQKALILLLPVTFPLLWHMYKIIFKITPHVLNTHSKMTYKNNVPYVQMRFWQAQNYMQKLHLGTEKTLFTNSDRYLISMG